MRRANISVDSDKMRQSSCMQWNLWRSSEIEALLAGKQQHSRAMHQMQHHLLLPQPLLQHLLQLLQQQMLPPQLRQLPHLQLPLQLAELQFLQHRCRAGAGAGAPGSMLINMLINICFMAFMYSGMATRAQRFFLLAALLWNIGHG